jgi:hypothetical protein
MRFLADENIPGVAVRALQANGYDLTALPPVLTGYPVYTIVNGTLCDSILHRRGSAKELPEIPLCYNKRKAVNCVLYL